MIKNQLLLFLFMMINSQSLNSGEYDTIQHPHYGIPTSQTSVEWSCIFHSTRTGKPPITACNTNFLQVFDYVIPEISHKWYEFGSAFAITPPQLEEIKENHLGDRNHQAFGDIIQIWQTEYSRPFTWEILTIMSVSQVNGREYCTGVNS